MIVDGDVHELPARQAELLAVAANGRLAAAITGDAVAGLEDPAELHDVDVDQLDRPAALIAMRRLGRLESRSLAKPSPRQDRRDRRESAILSAVAICAAVIRKRRRKFAVLEVLTTLLELKGVASQRLPSPRF